MATIGHSRGQAIADVFRGLDALKRMHAATKATRGRGTEEHGELAAIALLKSLEKEHDLIRIALDNAWAGLEAGKDWRKYQRHADAAQQRLHRAIKRLEKRAARTAADAR